MRSVRLFVLATIVAMASLMPSRVDACRSNKVILYQDPNGASCCIGICSCCGIQVCALSSETIGYETGEVYCYYDCGDTTWSVCGLA
jgi:hypothetical protein